MTDNEWIANVHNFSNSEIFEQLENIGCDGYYRDIWSACIEELQRRVNLTSGDLIRREVINSEIEKRYCSKHCVLPSEEPYCPDNCPARFLKNIVKECPSVPERPQGEWIYDEKLCNWKCSECGETPKTIGYAGNREFMTEHFKYCNHCGADMRKGGAES